MNLLYPYGQEKKKPLSADAWQHLALDDLTELISVRDFEKEIVKNVLSYIPCDEKTIAFRQEILKDFFENEMLCADLQNIMKKLDVLRDYRDHNHFFREKKASIWELIDYMQEMEVYIQIIEEMNLLFENHSVTAEGLCEMAQALSDVIKTDKLAEIKELIESLKTEIGTVKSITLGINLTSELYPEEVILMSMNPYPFKSKLIVRNWSASISAMRDISYKEHSQLMKYLTRDLEKELSQKVRGIQKELRTYVNLKGYFLLDICNDLKYYLLMAGFARKMKGDGYNICFPEISSKSDKVVMKGVYNVRLTDMQPETIVKNDFIFSEQEKIFILTGPNRGGKTMLTQAVGVAALLAAEGAVVMADAYKGYTFEDIFTHFPADENQTLNLGRLGEEAVRVQQIVKEATSRTLVLFNETYSSTCASDGLYLARDLVRILKHKNIPTIFNTHIHELAHGTEKMKEWTGTSDVVSLTMEIVDNVNTFRLLRSEPDSCSYAHNIALRYGITYEQMLGENTRFI